MTTRAITTVLVLSLTNVATHIRADDPQDGSLNDDQRIAARDRGLDWLVEHQSSDGSWGSQYSEEAAEAADGELLRLPGKLHLNTEPIGERQAAVRADDLNQL